MALQPPAFLKIYGRLQSSESRNHLEKLNHHRWVARVLHFPHLPTLQLHILSVEERQECGGGKRLHGDSLKDLLDPYPHESRQSLRLHQGRGSLDRLLFLPPQVDYLPRFPLGCPAEGKVLNLGEALVQLVQT